MYCSRRGREVSRPTDTCSRCGRCNWEQNQSSPRKAPLLPILLLTAAILLVILLIK